MHPGQLSAGRHDDGYEEYARPHASSDNWLSNGPGRLAHHMRIRRIHAQRKSRCLVSEQVDPKEMCREQRQDESILFNL